MVKSNRQQEVLIVGTGYVGLITALGLAKLGHRVSCYDINSERIGGLRRGKAPFFEPDVNKLVRELSAAGQLAFYTSLKDAYDDHRYIFVAVPTPQNEAGKSDMRPLFTAVTSIAETVRRKALVIVKSTVPVGIFDELEILPAVKTNQQLTFVSCPEFLSEGTAVRDFFHPLRTVVGANEGQIAEEVAGLFHGLGGKYILTNPKTAQMIKYSANSFLATRVAFINEIAQICRAEAINVNDVETALVMDPRVGGAYLSPSIGFAGPCLPKDIAALIEGGERAGVTSYLLRGARDQNIHHVEYIISRILELLGKERSVAVFGLSFKPNTDDVRNAFSLKIIEALNNKGVIVRATDPQAISFASCMYSHEYFEVYEDPYVVAEDTSVQIFLTAWQEYHELDYEKLANRVKVKRIFDGMRAVSAERARAAGFSYEGVGNQSSEGSEAIVSDNPLLMSL